MKRRKLQKLLRLWQENDLLTGAQADNILEFMKERQKELFFKMLKWLMIIGTFCLVFGAIATFINLLELDIFHKIFIAFCTFFKNIGIFILKYILIPIHHYLISPFCSFINELFGEKRFEFYKGSFSLIIALIFILISTKSKQKNYNEVDSLNLSAEQKNVLRTNWVLDIISCIALSIVFMSYNSMLIPLDIFYNTLKIIPMWNILGAFTFILMAYGLKKNLYLIFGIYFITLSVGMFSGYSEACYWIGASRPVIQILVSVILLMIGYITQLKLDDKNDDNNYLQEKFAGTYNWMGLLMLFIALWIASFWGFQSEFMSSNPSGGEIWTANILFIASSIGAMYWGAKTEQKLFFNYGLTFLIIETYTILCARLWEHLPIGIATLLFGGLLIGTGKFLQKIYLKKNIK